MLIKNSASKTTLETHIGTFLKNLIFCEKSCATIRMAKIGHFEEARSRAIRDLYRQVVPFLKALLLSYRMSILAFKMDKVEMGFEPSRNPDFRTFS